MDVQSELTMRPTTEGVAPVAVDLEDLPGSEEVVILHMGVEEVKGVHMGHLEVEVTFSKDNSPSPLQMISSLEINFLDDELRQGYKSSHAT